MKSTNYYRCSLVKEREIGYHNIHDSNGIFRIMQDLGYTTSDEEYFILFCLKSNGDISGIHEVSHGDISSAPVNPVCVFKRALLNNSTAIIVAHNHPSWDVTPSEDDLTTTKRLIDAGKVLGVKVLDHIITGGENYHSLRDDLEF